MTPPPDDLQGTPGADERYERGARIATGGMGEVWRARDTVLGREVAVKILKREYAEDPTFRARFEAEARHAAGLHHPGIASVFDYGLLKEDNAPYLVMELVDGKPLSDLITEGRPFDPEQSRLLALQVAEALAVAHQAGVVHRDVKPANLLVTPDGRIKITDFGIARATGSVAFTQTGQIVGTPQYLSPEQARGNSATAASDVYALGIVLFECLSGHRPFVADTPIATALAQIQQDVPPLPDSVPPALAAIVTRALAKDPAERYADGAAIADALRSAGPGGAPVAAAVAAPVTEPIDATRLMAATAVAPVAAAAAPTPPPAAPPAEPPAEPPGTLAGNQDEQRSRWPLYALGLLVVVLLVALLIAHPWSDDDTANNGNDSSEPADPTSDTVNVSRAAYLGKPVETVVADLREKGLKTTVRTKDNPDGQDVDTVANLSPTGDVKKGATITIDAWGEKPADEPEDQPTEAEPTQDEPSEPAASENSGPGKSGQSKAPKPDKSKKPGAKADKTVPGAKADKTVPDTTQAGATQAADTEKGN